MTMAKEKKLNLGDWYDHVLGWYENAGKENFLFLKFEDMVKDGRTQVTTFLSNRIMILHSGQ